MGSQRVQRTEPLSVIANTPELSKIKIIFLFWSEFKWLSVSYSQPVRGCQHSEMPAFSESGGGGDGHLHKVFPTVSQQWVWARDRAFLTYKMDLLMHLLWVCVDLLSRVGLSMTLWTVACQAPLSTGFPGKNTGEGCHFFLQGIFPTQESNPWLLHWQEILYHWAIYRLCLDNEKFHSTGYWLFY